MSEAAEVSALRTTSDWISGWEPAGRLTFLRFSGRAAGKKSSIVCRATGGLSSRKARASCGRKSFSRLPRFLATFDTSQAFSSRRASDARDAEYPSGSFKGLMDHSATRRDSIQAKRRAKARIFFWGEGVQN